MKNLTLSTSSLGPNLSYPSNSVLIDKILELDPSITKDIPSSPSSRTNSWSNPNEDVLIEYPGMINLDPEYIFAEKIDELITEFLETPREFKNFNIDTSCSFITSYVWFGRVHDHLRMILKQMDPEISLEGSSDGKTLINHDQSICIDDTSIYIDKDYKFAHQVDELLTQHEIDLVNLDQFSKDFSALKNKGKVVLKSDAGKTKSIEEWMPDFLEKLKEIPKQEPLMSKSEFTTQVTTDLLEEYINSEERKSFKEYLVENNLRMKGLSYSVILKEADKIINGRNVVRSPDPQTVDVRSSLGDQMVKQASEQPQEYLVTLGKPASQVRKEKFLLAVFEYYKFVIEGDIINRELPDMDKLDKETFDLLNDDYLNDKGMFEGWNKIPNPSSGE